MATCPKCNNELIEGAKFCDNCGSQVFETVFCPNCGTQTSTEFAFCQSCGASIMEPPAEENPVENPVKNPVEAPVEKKKLPVKAIMFGGIGVAVVAVLVLVIALFSGGGKAKNNYALYLKDSEIFFSDLKKNSDAWQLTTRLDDSGEIANELMYEAAGNLSSYTYMSQDGKYIFFPDKVSSDDDGCNLYYKEVGKPDEDAVKIDSDIQLYTVNDSATLITYIKGDDNLYQYNIRKDEKEKIASEVWDFTVSDDGKQIIYVNYEDSLYRQIAGEDKEKIASDIFELEYVTEDFSTVYYTKEQSLYKQEKDSDKEKLASDVYNVVRIYDSGEFYYITSENEATPLMAYVSDDMKSTDASMTEPVYPTFPIAPVRPDRVNFSSSDDYNAAYTAYQESRAEWEAECARMESEYNAACEAYWAKLSRDELRTELEGKTLDQSYYSLYYYDGSEKYEITDACASSYPITASEAPVIIYKVFNQASFEKVKLSEVVSVYDIESLAEAALFSSAEWYIASKDAATFIELEYESTHFRVNSSGTLVYYIDNVPDEKNYGDLYQISINKGVVGSPEVYDSDVYYSAYNFVSDDELQYFKDFKDAKGEFYINENRIDYDVNPYDIVVDSNLEKVFYYVDWDDDKEYGTLKVYQDGDSKKIDDDVNFYTVTPDGRVLYLYDFSQNHYKGELYEWNNGKKRKLDDDVIAVLPFIDSKYRGDEYGW